MRDIRPDLRERIDAERHGREDLMRQLDAFEERIRGLESLLAAEETRLMDEAAGVDIQIVPAAALDDFLFKAIGRGVSVKEELRDAAIKAGYFPRRQEFPGRPGRVVHATLLHMVKAERIAINGKGEYVLTNTGKNAPERGVQERRAAN